MPTVETLVEMFVKLQDKVKILEQTIKSQNIRIEELEKSKKTGSIQVSVLETEAFSRDQADDETQQASGNNKTEKSPKLGDENSKNMKKSSASVTTNNNNQTVSDGFQHPREQRRNILKGVHGRQCTNKDVTGTSELTHKVQAAPQQLATGTFTIYVVLSTTFSKLIELYILYKCDNFSFNKLQFGFIKGRGTDSAVALAHDISSYFVNNGSQVYMCNLDAEGTFDALPFPVIFSKLYHVLPEMCWKILYNWYHKIKVQIKWNKMGKPIKMCKGTKQGGLSSPFIFNIFYKELLDILEIQEGGISIGNRKYNVICYADDLLLLSSTVTGLQGLINKANAYIVDHGLRFNPNKTKCIINGKNPFIKDPNWYINELELELVEHINFLGCILGNNCSKYHSASRISSCRKSFYALQSVGLCEKGLSIDAAVYIWTSICKTSLLYG